MACALVGCGANVAILDRDPSLADRLMDLYRDQVMETAGLYNTVGFNDDTRAFPSIPARHDLSRRVDANWIAGLVVQGIIDVDDAHEMILDTAYRLAKRAYKLGD